MRDRPFIVMWGAKGGVGTTVAAAIAALTTTSDGLLVDLDGDIAHVLGAHIDPATAGINNWINGDHGLDELNSAATAVGSGTRLLHAGTGPRPDPHHDRWNQFADYLTGEPDMVVVDTGTGTPPPALAAAGTGLIVTRPCYLALRHGLEAREHADGVIVINEPGRALTTDDIANVLNLPIVANIEVDPNIARAVDAGLGQSRLPRIHALNLDNLTQPATRRGTSTPHIPTIGEALAGAEHDVATADAHLTAAADDDDWPTAAVAATAARDRPDHLAKVHPQTDTSTQDPSTGSRIGPDIDYGTRWTTAERPGEVWRVSWNTASGDLYATRHGDHHTETLANLPTRIDVDRALAGWTEHATEPDGLTWLRATTATLHPPPADVADESTNALGRQSSAPTRQDPPPTTGLNLT